MNPETQYKTTKTRMIGDAVVRTSYYQSGEKTSSISYSNPRIGGMAALMFDDEIIPRRGLERIVERKKS